MVCYNTQAVRMKASGRSNILSPGSQTASSNTLGRRTNQADLRILDQRKSERVEYDEQPQREPVKGSGSWDGDWNSEEIG